MVWYRSTSESVVWDCPCFTITEFEYIFATIFAGAVGNLYDRVKFSAVPDFIDIHYNNFHWFTFNIADIFISLGIIMLSFGPDRHEIAFENIIGSFGAFEPTSRACK